MPRWDPYFLRNQALRYRASPCLGRLHTIVRYRGDTTMPRLTKADMAQMIHNLEAQVQRLEAQARASATPSAAESQAAIAHVLEHGHVTCLACDGSGLHSSGGDCFRCKGKGYQDAEDLARNAAYDRLRAGRRETAGREGYASIRAIPLEIKRGKQLRRIDGLYYVVD